VVLLLLKLVQFWRYLSSPTILQLYLPVLNLLQYLFHLLILLILGYFLGSPAMESDVLNILLDHVMVYPVNTISHIPCSIRPLLAYVLNIELQKAVSSVWGFMRLFMLPRLCYVPLFINLTTAVAVFLVPYLLIAFMFGLNLIELKFFSLLCKKISRILSLLSKYQVVSSINHVLYFGLMKVGI